MALFQCNIASKSAVFVAFSLNILKRNPSQMILLLLSPNDRHGEANVGKWKLLSKPGSEFRVVVDMKMWFYAAR